MKKMIFFCAVLFMAFLRNVYGVEYEIVMDADSGRVLYGKNIDEKRLIASTTKIMTTLVVLRNMDLNRELTVGEEVLDAYGSSIYIKPGEKMKVIDMLYGLMLRSGNDSALTLAVNTAGSVEGFSILMNETAASIGMKNTTFTNPHGLDEETQNTSTVYDMALLMREAMKNKTFRKITGTKHYKVKTNMNVHDWYNKNELLSNYKYATGGKIGYTGAARHTFVSSATKDGKNLIVATFVDENRFITHKKLYEKYFPLYNKYNLIDKDHLNINYKPGVRLYTKESFNMLLTEEESKNIVKSVTLYNDVSIGNDETIIGDISVGLDGVLYKRMKIYGVKANIKESKSFWKKIKEFFKW